MGIADQNVLFPAPPMLETNVSFEQPPQQPLILGGTTRPVPWDLAGDLARSSFYLATGTATDASVVFVWESNHAEDALKIREVQLQSTQVN